MCVCAARARARTCVCVIPAVCAFMCAAHPQCMGARCPLPPPPPPSSSLQQCTVLREGQQGFTFESNRGSRVEMKAESSSVQFDFAPRNPWCSGKKTYKTKQELLEEKVSPAP